MQILISDTNILIDMEEGQLIEQFFQLPYEFTVPDILFSEELEAQHAHLVDMGLKQKPLTEESVISVFSIKQQFDGLSINDCFALKLAEQENCPLLTGDRLLREVAEKSGVEVMGSLWLMREMLRNELLSLNGAKIAHQKMLNAGRRLPKWETTKDFFINNEP